MDRKKKEKILLELGLIVVSLAALSLLVYFVLAVSFQNGEASIGVTMRFAQQLAGRIFEEPTEEQSKPRHGSYATARIWDFSLWWDL